ncbi:hypothetical protein Gogos_022183 [Gossypium gossypioides]|uniref:Uncharacterized protein n=1 Tax=Gossypium gossypioides TaxID=34282 RepID=A0A7J9D7F2_GOSGO|nr:hypothetical protein [Gossypium gossypioides]
MVERLKRLTHNWQIRRFNSYWIKVRGVNVPVTEMTNIEIFNGREKDVDILDRNNNTRGIQSRTNDTKSQDVEEVCLL